MCFFVVFILSHFKNLPSDDTREVSILFILYHEQWLWTWYVLKEHTTSSNRIESFYWNPLLRPDCIRTQEKKRAGEGEFWDPRQTVSIEPEELNPRIWKVLWTMHSYPFKHSIDTTRRSHVCLTLCWKVGELNMTHTWQSCSWSERWKYAESQWGKRSWLHDLHGAYMATHEEQGLCWEELVVYTWPPPDVRVFTDLNPYLSSFLAVFSGNMPSYMPQLLRAWFH